MLESIKEKYNHYIEIHDNILPRIENHVARTLLENSLYLSVFTSFEYFLKKTIEHYVSEMNKKGIKYVDLNEEFARQYILDNQRSFDNIFKIDDTKSKNAFSRYFKKLKDPLSSEDLRKYIRFEFLHETKLSGYYPNLFSQILGKENFLKEIEVSYPPTYIEVDLDQITTSDAYTFLSDYCKKIRNNIAHNNDSFNISKSSFSDVVSSFILIMEKIKEEYERYTKFELSEDINNNLLDVS